MKPGVRGALVLAFLAGATLVAIALAQAQPLDALATPTPVCIEEIEAVAAIFLVSVVLMQPARDALERNRSAISDLLRARVDLPVSARTAAIVVLVAGMFGFAFWAIADVLGGYNGYGYSSSTYPVLHLIYDYTIGLVPFVSARDKGTQASFYLALSLVGLVALRSNRGIGVALKDTITLFAAPILVIFELGVWNFAPDDMTWHVTDFLWIGGANDGGWRAYDYPGSGDFLVSNWLVLFIAFLLVAYRIPWMSLPSKMVWQRMHAWLRRDTPSTRSQESRVE